ncbi:AsnC family transcriptional regulator [Clostridium saudiense]|nr:AsnC family transcriptional regulator [Clostridium saudiense]
MIDNTDRLILKELVKNSRITMKELGDRVHLTGQAVANRVMKL